MTNPNPQQVFNLSIPVSTHLFRTGHGATALADAASIEMLFLTGPHPVQVFIGAQADGVSIATLFENTIVSFMGTPLTVVDFNRNSPRISESVAFHTPTVTGDGTSIVSEDILAGDRKDTFGASVSNRFPIILAPNLQYMVRLTNASGGDARVQISLDWLPTPRIVG